MQTLSLSATSRTVSGKKVATLRRSGVLPAVMYGHGTEPLSIECDARTFAAIWHTAGSNQLVDLAIDGKGAVKVLIHDTQIHPVTGKVLHADLYQVKMSEKLETDIPLKFVGESAAVKDLQGSLILEKDTLEVRCLPADLVAEFEVDLAQLATFDDIIKVSDIKVPTTIEILNDPEETIALVHKPKSEEELEAELAEPTKDEEEAAIGELTKDEAPAEADTDSDDK